MSRQKELLEIPYMEELGERLADMVVSKDYNNAQQFIIKHLNDLDFDYLWTEYGDDPTMRGILQDISEKYGIPRSYGELVEEIDEKLSNPNLEEEERRHLLEELKSYLGELVQSEKIDVNELSEVAARDPRLLEWFLGALGDRRANIDYEWLIGILHNYYKIYHPLVKWLIAVADQARCMINYKDLLYNLTDDSEAFFYVKAKMEENGGVLGAQGYWDLLAEAQEKTEVYEWLAEEIRKRGIPCLAEYIAMEEF